MGSWRVVSVEAQIGGETMEKRSKAGKCGRGDNIENWANISVDGGSLRWKNVASVCGNIMATLVNLPQPLPPETASKISPNSLGIYKSEKWLCPDINNMKDKGYKCPVEGCRQRYATRYNVRRHTASAHPDFTLNACPTCHRVLSSRQNLRQHMSIHTGDRPYKCTFCEEHFRQSSQLSLHKRQHFVDARAFPIAKVMAT